MGFWDMISTLSFLATIVVGIFLIIKKEKGKMELTPAILGEEKVEEVARSRSNKRITQVTKISDELLDKMGFYFSHPLTQEIHPHYKQMTFEQFLKREIRRLESKPDVKEYIWLN